MSFCCSTIGAALCAGLCVCEGVNNDALLLCATRRPAEGTTAKLVNTAATMVNPMFAATDADDDDEATD